MLHRNIVVESNWATVSVQMVSISKEQCLGDLVLAKTIGKTHHEQDCFLYFLSIFREPWDVANDHLC